MFDAQCSMASESLVDLLPRCEVVALVVKDEAQRLWKDSLTTALKALGAKQVPPAYRASRAFLWIRGARQWEAYDCNGVAELSAEVLQRT